ncbi:MAG: M14 family metallopeptidase [Elusimicrobiota bacterium]
MKKISIFVPALLLLSVGAVAADKTDSSVDFDMRSPGKTPAWTFDFPAVPQKPEPAPDDDRVWAVVGAADRDARNAAADSGMSIDVVSPDSVAGVATPGSIARLKAAGLRVLSTRPLEIESALDFPPADSAYHTYDQTMSELAAIAARAPDLSSVFSIGRTWEGREIKVLRLCPDAAGQKPSRLPGILFIGLHHSREHLSAETPLLLARRLVESRGDPQVARLLQSRDIYVIPMLNPDGAEHDIQGGRYGLWRKNMRPGGRTGSSTGVDLNRNYAWHWGTSGASPYPADETYRGPSAFSEPETQAVKAFVESRANLTTLLSYHTFDEMILYPWSDTDAPMKDAEALKAYRAMAQAMGRMTGYTPMQSGALYASSGDTADWSWGTRGIFSWTFELTPKSGTSTYAGFYPGAAAIAIAVQANWRPMLYLIDLADDPRRVIRRSSAENVIAFAPPQ